MGKVYNRPGTNVIIVEDDDGRVVWSSELQPVNLLPEQYWLNTTRDIAFPDFTKFANYAHQRLGVGDAPYAGQTGDTCQTVTMIDELQDWTGADIELGEVLPGVNYIDVRVRARRTKNPSAFLDQPVPQLVAPNQWAHLPGGSCLIEATTIWRRLFEVVLDGNRVLLRRRHSVAAIPANAVALYGGIYKNSGVNRNAFTTSSYGEWGWVTGDGGAWVGSQRNGHPAALIEVKPYSGNSPGDGTPSMGAKHPTRSARCSVNIAQHDFSSIYNADIVVQPGYMKP